MDYQDLININSENPDPELLKKFIKECESHIKFYKEEYTKTKKRYYLGKITKYVRWKKEAEFRLSVKLKSLNLKLL